MPKNNLMAPFVASMFADVNGVPMEPVGAPSGAITDCGGTFMFPLPPMFGYTLTASFWLDLDQAEAASPARLYQPAARGEARGR